MTDEFNITIDDVVKINVDDGDALLVTLPEGSVNMPNVDLGKFIENVSRVFRDAFDDKKIKVIVVPYGMQVELIQSSTLKEKD